jgi:LmbE family N-acetylglucosaminyl deacetylase
VLVAAPHMDDEVLACGGLIALLRDSSRVHVVFATDGRRSPAPLVPVLDSVAGDLYELRRRESMAAAAILGIPDDHLHFLGLPEAELARHEPALQRSLSDLIARVEPDAILMPFRYDRHPDHLAVNRAVRAASASGSTGARLFEYFVYHRWRLLPGRDLRAFVRPDHLLEVDISSVAARKRAALDCFKTQTTRYFAWQTRPILTPELLDEECAASERFLLHDPALPGVRVFSHGRWWIPIAHTIEPVLQRWKYRLGAWLKRATRTS